MESPLVTPRTPGRDSPSPASSLSVAGDSILQWHSPTSSPAPPPDYLSDDSGLSSEEEDSETDADFLQTNDVMLIMEKLDMGPVTSISITAVRQIRKMMNKMVRSTVKDAKKLYKESYKKKKRDKSFLKCIDHVLQARLSDYQGIKKHYNKSMDKARAACVLQKHHPIIHNEIMNATWEHPIKDPMKRCRRRRPARVQRVQPVEQVEQVEPAQPAQPVEQVEPAQPADDDMELDAELMAALRA